LGTRSKRSAPFYALEHCVGPSRVEVPEAVCTKIVRRPLSLDLPDISGRFFLTIPAALHHHVVLLLEIDFAFGTDPSLLLADSRLQIPARYREIENRRAVLSDFFRTAPDFPAGRHGEKLFHARDVESVLGEEPAEALQPLKVVVGIETLAAAPGRLHETLLLVDAERARVNIEEFRDNADGIQGFATFDVHELRLLRKIALQGHLTN